MDAKTEKVPCAESHLLCADRLPLSRQQGERTKRHRKETAVVKVLLNFGGGRTPSPLLDAGAGSQTKLLVCPLRYAHEEGSHTRRRGARG